MKALHQLSSVITACVFGLAMLGSAPTAVLAAKSNPNPFAGEYCGTLGAFDSIYLSIADSGRVIGYIANALTESGPISGKISDDGVITLTWKPEPSPGWFWASASPSSKKSHTTVSLIGLIEKYAEGKLTGVLMYENGIEKSLSAGPCASE